MTVDTQGRVLVSTHDLERAGALRTALKGVGYTVDLVTPGEDVSGDTPIQLLVITAEASSQSAHDLRNQARRYRASRSSTPRSSRWVHTPTTWWSWLAR